MESKYTKGPWSVDGFNLTAVIADSSEKNYKHICSCKFDYASPEANFELNKANAKLIAAAPELLEALQELIIELSPLYNFDASKYPDVMKKAEAAILKATSI